MLSVQKNLGFHFHRHFWTHTYIHIYTHFLSLIPWLVIYFVTAWWDNHPRRQIPFSILVSVSSNGWQFVFLFSRTVDSVWSVSWPRPWKWCISVLKPCDGWMQAGPLDSRKGFTAIFQYESYNEVFIRSLCWAMMLRCCHRTSTTASDESHLSFCSHAFKIRTIYIACSPALQKIYFP